MDARLPEPSPDAQRASTGLVRLIADEIHASGGWISFARYMELALYTPQLGYYSGGSLKFGEAGDFLTAPELTPLFGQALAVQVAQILGQSEPVVLEAGAGSGHLAADLLDALDTQGSLPDKYLILDLSGELRARQRETLAARVPYLLPRVEWIGCLPERFSGCVIANELLDALPNHAVAWTAQGIQERGVGLDAAGRLAWSTRPASGNVLAAADELSVEAPYESEIALAARAWVAEWGHRLQRGALLLVDYGLPRHEFYHPQRNRGTLRCHYRHRVHDDPFWFPGLCDITAHVDFTAIAEAGHDAGLEVLGYTAQAPFLINCGIGDLLAAKTGTADPADQARARGAVNLLLSPNEMGELFKVIALGRGFGSPLLGFSRGDRLHML